MSQTGPDKGHKTSDSTGRGSKRVVTYTKFTATFDTLSGPIPDYSPSCWTDMFYILPSKLICYMIIKCIILLQSVRIQITLCTKPAWKGLKNSWKQFNTALVLELHKLARNKRFRWCIDPNRIIILGKTDYMGSFLAYNRNNLDFFWKFSRAYF